jgi:hypothetical protein
MRDLLKRRWHRARRLPIVRRDGLMGVGRDRCSLNNRALPSSANRPLLRAARPFAPISPAGRVGRLRPRVVSITDVATTSYAADPCVPQASTVAQAKYPPDWRIGTPIHAR